MNGWPRVGFRGRIFRDPKTGEYFIVQRDVNEPGPFPPLVVPPEFDKPKDGGVNEPEKPEPKNERPS